jgi:hypothetical protein
MQIQVLTSLLLVNLLSPQDKTLTGHTEANNGPIILKSLKAKKAVKPKPEKLEAFVPMHISAIGMLFEEGTGKILMVDAASDLYRKVLPGDYLISTGGESLEKSDASLNYFGDAGTIIDVVISQNGVLVTYHCHRKPIEKFGPMLRDGFLKKLRP